MRRTTGIALLLLGFGACTCGKNEEKKADQAAADQADSKKPNDPAAARQRADALRKMKMAPLTLEEVQPLIPALPGATPVGKPGVMTMGRQVKAVFCMTSKDVDTAMSVLVAELGKLGFTGAETHPHPQNQEMITVRADKDPFRLGGTAQKTTTPDCPGDKGKIKIVLSYFKRVTIDAP